MSRKFKNVKINFCSINITIVTLVDANVELMQEKVHIRFNAKIASLNANSLLNKILHRGAAPLISGSVDAIAVPEYDAEMGSFFLRQVKLVGMDIQGVRNGKKYKKAVQKLMADYLDKHPVYTLRETNVKNFLAKYFFKNIAVKGHELHVQFGL